MAHIITDLYIKYKRDVPAHQSRDILNAPSEQTLHQAKWKCLQAVMHITYNYSNDRMGNQQQVLGEE